ncbi:hypothetical protein VB773_04305 [Haloarculaceae archaeon H-GB2-1]|nr:hypothetical protein [Haloarculaceae archaeon H-GB11]MEA5406878.1 hypothetical protein [Haloarculaceae archaeon H-GB2-1]
MNVTAHNGTYAGVGEHETDANGTVSLVLPEENVTVEAVAVDGNDTANATATLVGVEPELELTVEETADDVEVLVTRNGTAVENATVNVTSENGTYDGDGEYATGADGVANLPTPETAVTVELVATEDDDSVARTVELTPAEERYENFGQRVSAYTQELVDEDSSDVGLWVSAFVTEHNPGNPPAHAGPNQERRENSPENGEQPTATETDSAEDDESDEAITEDAADSDESDAETSENDATAADDAQSDDEDDTETAENDDESVSDEPSDDESVDDESGEDDGHPGNGKAKGHGSATDDGPGNGNGNSPGNGKAKGR